MRSTIGGRKARSARPRGRIRVQVALLAVVGAGLAAVVPAPAAVAEAGAKRSGFAIKATGRADSAFLGGREMGGALTYRFEPRKKDVASTYGPVALVADLDGAKGPSATATQQAACVLSTFGGRRNKIQSAGVDAAVYHLLRGGKWRISKKYGAARIRQAGSRRSYVRSYATTMLRHCAAYAGPYKVQFSGTGAPVGTASKLSYRITSASGRPMTNIAVRFTYGGRSQSVFTDGTGSASAFFDVTGPGAVRATAAAVRLPDWRLAVRAPVRRKASRVAVGGRLITQSSSAVVNGTGSQTVRVLPTAGTVRLGAGMDGTWRVDGGEGDRGATLRVYGPFGTTSSGCSGTPAAQFSRPVSGGGGSSALPGFVPRTSGYYRWQVVVGGNEFTTPTSVCAAPVRVQRQGSVIQGRPEGRTKKVGVGDKFDINVGIGGFDRAEGHIVTSRLYGPFANEASVACRADKLVASKTQTKNVSGNGTYNMGNVAVTNADNTGFYVWQTTLSNGDLILGGVSSCSVIYQVVR